MSNGCVANERWNSCAVPWNEVCNVTGSPIEASICLIDLDGLTERQNREEIERKSNGWKSTLVVDCDCAGLASASRID